MQTEIHIFHVTAVEILGKQAYRIKAFAGDVEAKARSVGNIDDPPRIDRRCNRINRQDLIDAANVD